MIHMRLIRLNALFRDSTGNQSILVLIVGDEFISGLVQINTNGTPESLADFLLAGRRPERDAMAIRKISSRTVGANNPETRGPVFCHHDFKMINTRPDFHLIFVMTFEK